MIRQRRLLLQSHALTLREADLPRCTCAVGKAIENLAGRSMSTTPIHPESGDDMPTLSSCCEGFEYIDDPTSANQDPSGYTSLSSSIRSPQASTDLLWLSAGPGCSKSDLSRSLIDEGRLSTRGDAHHTHGAHALSAILHLPICMRGASLSESECHFRA
jgi:hypothetical protein